MATATSAARQAQFAEQLRKMIKPGDTVTTVVRHVTASGMSRTIATLIIDDGRIVNVSGQVAAALGWKWDDKLGGVKVSGAGMDMGFHLVYTLASVLFPGHESLDEACSAGRLHTMMGGYALHHEWV